MDTLEVPKVHYYSFWQLFGLYNKCPYSYDLGYAQRKDRPPSTGKYQMKMYLGSAFHHAMEVKVKQGLPWAEITTPELCNHWVQAVRTDLSHSPINDALVDILAAELKRAFTLMEGQGFEFIFDSVDKAESPFKVTVGDLNLSGRPDASGLMSVLLENMMKAEKTNDHLRKEILKTKFTEEDRFVLDFKLSDGVSTDASKQIRFYSLAQPFVVGWIVYPMQSLFKSMRWTQPLRDDLKIKVNSLVTAIESGDRTPNHKSCGWCNYLGACDKASAVSVLMWKQRQA